ncbi:MAG: galactosyldiacylglycerol synthase [Thiothrix sp.]|nr:MAG: galactosyldiacylglycerol synthase [Thiothrix sp.]
MIILTNKDTGLEIGTITETQLQFLVDQLEEESPTDTDYWLNRAELEIFKENGADPDLVALLEKGMGEAEDMEVSWARR